MNTDARLGVILCQEGMGRCFLGAGRTGQCTPQVIYKYEHLYQY